MASKMKQLGEELTCAICMDAFDDPVTLSCGHNFCLSCIAMCWESSAIASCPQCRHVFPVRPSLQKNTTLANVVRELLAQLSVTDGPAHSQEQQCAECLPEVRAADKSCFTCDLSFCNNHAQRHMTPVYSHHQVVEPAVNLAKRKCPEHGERLKYVCSEDKALLCVDCTRVGAHRTHEVVTVEQEDAILKAALQGKLNTVQQKMEAITANKQEFCSRDGEIKGACTSYTATVEKIEKELKLFLDTEVKATKEILSTQQAVALQKANVGADDLNINLSEMQKLKRTMLKLLQMDSLSYVQEYPTEAERIDLLLAQIPDRVAPPELEKQKVLDNLAWLDNVLTHVKNMQKMKNLFPWKLFNKRKLVMDMNTAHPNLLISQDRRMAVYSEESQNYLEHERRFECVLQVLCTESFSSGEHYWEVYVKGGTQWEVGVTYGSIGRKQHNEKNVLGNNAISWCFSMANGEYSSWHNGNKSVANICESIEIIGVHLDCDAGTVVFYNAESMAQLQSFTTKFTQPLFPAFGVYPNSSLALCDFGFWP